jgi:hypothetical protein
VSKPLGQVQSNISGTKNWTLGSVLTKCRSLDQTMGPVLNGPFWFPGGLNHESNHKYLQVKCSVFYSRIGYKIVDSGLRVNGVKGMHVFVIYIILVGRGSILRTAK